MALVRWRPSLLSPVERLFDDLMAEREGEGLLGTWNPRVNMYEKGDNLIVEAELPGVKKEDIDVRLEDRQLTLRGECREEKETKEDDYFRRERRYGSFTRSLTLPSSVTGDKVEASYKDGILRLTLPKTEEAKGKQIPIK
jgi:HSP20 family protein